MQRALWILLAVLISSAASAEGGWYVNAGVGRMEVSGEDYDAGDFYRLLAGYRLNPYFAVETATEAYDRMTLRGDHAVWLNGFGQLAAAQGRVTYRRLTFRGDAGVVLWRLYAHAFDRAAGRDQGVSPYLDFGLNIALPAKIRLGGEIAWRYDISGRMLYSNMLHAGFEF